MNSPDQSLATRKEELDVSRIFLSYLAAAGDVVEAAQIANCKLDDVLFLARSECWAAKLADAGVVRGKTKEDAQLRMREVNRVTAYIQGIRLRGLIDRTLQYVYEKEDNLMEFATERDKKGEAFFSTKPILDLTKAAVEVHAMIYRALGDVQEKPVDGAGVLNGSSIRNLHLTVVQAMNEAPGTPEAVLKKAEPAESKAVVKSVGYLDVSADSVLAE